MTVIDRGARCLASILLLAMSSAASGQMANIGNFVWMDSNRNGVQNVGEPGIAGVTVQLWNGAMNQLLAQTTTNANGNYTLVGPTSTSLRVRAVLPNADLRFSPKDAGGNDLLDSDVNDSAPALGFTDAFTLASNVISITSIDIGMMTPAQANLGNFVWEDLDQDGIQDAQEPGLGGVVVQLWNSAMNQLLASTTSSAQGIYQLTTPEPGNYRLRVVAPAGFVFSPKDQGGNDTLDSDFNPTSPVGFTDVYAISPSLISITSIDAGLGGNTIFRNGFQNS